MFSALNKEDFSKSDTESSVTGKGKKLNASGNERVPSKVKPHKGPKVWKIVAVI
jgi:hypothetical protein